MKTIPAPIAQEYAMNWQKLRQEKITSAFEIFDEKEGEYQRITARKFGQISAEFIEKLGQIDLNNEKDGLSLNFGIDKNSETVHVFWEVKLGGESTFFAGEGDSFLTFMSQGYDPTKPHCGVSVNYKNEVTANWASLPYYAMNSIFFTEVADQNNKKAPISLFLNRPKRVKKFIIPQADLEVIKNEVTEEKNILVHYGVNYGEVARQLIPFVPVIQIYTPNLEGVSEEDDDDSTYLDFVETCPPVCPD